MAYLILLALGALDAAGYSVIAPVVPQIADATGAQPVAIGVLVATFPAGMVFGFAAAGEGVKRRKTTPVMVLALLLMAAGCVGFVVSSSLPVYFGARFVMGLGSGCLWMGVTFNALERWPGQEYLCMSRILAAYSAGGLIGPALGAIGGIHGPFLAYLALVCSALVLVPFLGAPAQHRPFLADRSALRLRGFWAASAAILFSVLALGVIEGVLPLHLAAELSQTQIGLAYAAVSLLVAASAAGAARLAPRRDVLAAALLVTGGLTLAGATHAAWLWILGLALTGVGVGLGNTGSIGLLLESVSPERIVTAMIIWSQLGIFGYLLGPIAAGTVAQGLGFGALGLVPLAAAAVLVPALRWAPGTAVPATSADP